MKVKAETRGGMKRWWVKPEREADAEIRGWVKRDLKKVVTSWALWCGRSSCAVTGVREWRRWRGGVERSLDITNG
jgi:hypothetical protein